MNAHFIPPLLDRFGLTPTGSGDSPFTEGIYYYNQGSPYWQTTFIVPGGPSNWTVWASDIVYLYIHSIHQTGRILS